jgi:hypothetical protein
MQFKIRSSEFGVRKDMKYPSSLPTQNYARCKEGLDTSHATQTETKIRNIMVAHRAQR